jgi:hypothetical protein
MQSFLFAELAELLKFQTLLGARVVLATASLGLVSQVVANRALQMCESFLGHNQILDLRLKI